MKGYGVRPRTIRIGEQTAKGYVKEELRETLRRYIPKSELEAVKADLRKASSTEEKATPLRKWRSLLFEAGVDGVR